MSSKKNKLRYPFDEHPKPGTTVELAPGVRWLTMPMPGSLAHINLYLLEDTRGWYIVDTGMATEETTQLWHDIFRSELGNKPINDMVSIISGKTAIEIVNTLIRNKYISSHQHAADMGIELCKAELALKYNLNYIQDKNLLIKSKNL